MADSMWVRFRTVWLGGIVIVAGLGAWGWVERKPVLAWHWTRQLAKAPSEECGRYADRLAALDEHAIAPLVDQLRAGPPAAKVNCGWALADLARRWSTGDPRATALSRELAAAFASLDQMGQSEALSIWRAMLVAMAGDQLPDWLARDVSRALALVARPEAEACRAEAVSLAAEFQHRARSPNAELGQAFVILVEAGLKDRRMGCRNSAIRLAAAPGVSLLDRVATLLTGPGHEPAAEVRLTALVALGGHEDFLATDDLLPYLHDADAEVRAVAEQALKSRGLLPGHVQLARQMTDPQPQVRARVPALVHDFPDLDSRLWLDRLSKDASPAVRAAVLRAAGDAREWRLAERMREMAVGDPSPTVRQIARYYLQQQLSEPAGGNNP